ncbi:Nif3-like dinuclear metal center hexameric protein [Methanotorris igneus]|uniref:NGG1p interacting factor 3 protein, NIF3 n=1 Tax=Methanotorris igneus (strain DSM 5666 / JCM 11834 / Kol 5) TaxID=880724 RepID=F6BEN7_METIK|nr:Nif3-like dinuclear metal center hexameric protein [Methanotorris igneus]AEF96834.1 NGG1p interacting factor 3 protein, NIF3 [Methanotorris igneus Kol 5]
MKAYEIIEIIENFAPKELAIVGDNVGLQVGDNLDKEVNKLGIALDPSLNVIKKAKKEGVDFLFTHHPILKNPIKNFTGIMYEKLKILMENDIILYSAHTNLDICKDGLNDALAELYKLKDVENLYENGLGRVGIFEGSFEELLDITKKYIVESPVVVGNIDGDNFKLAVLSGYGLSQDAIRYVAEKADVYLSGDLTHHSKILAEELGLVVVDGTHYGTEVYGLRKFMDYLKDMVDCEVVSLDF